MARNEPGPPNAANVADQHALDKGEKRRRRLELEDLRAVLSTGEGRRVIWRLLDKFGLYHSVFDRDPVVMAWLSGQQDAAQWFVRELAHINPAVVFRLAEEARARERREHDVDDALRTQASADAAEGPEP